jgi:hypothetical protein
MPAMGAPAGGDDRPPVDHRVVNWARRRTESLGQLQAPRALAELWAVVPRDRMLRWVRWAGLVLVLLAFAAMVRLLGDTWSGLRGWRPTPGLAAVFAGCAVGWMVISGCLGLGWAGLVQAFSGTPVKRRNLWRVHARIQVSRYLPGNTFQVGRHVFARSVGVGHTSLVTSAMVEAVVMIAAAAVLALAGLPRLAVPDIVPTTPMLLILAGIGAMTVALVLILTARLRPMLNLPGRHGSAMIRAFGIGILAFVAGGLILAALLAAQGRPLGLDDLGGLVAAFALSWVTGFLAPAAPEGVGVREAVLLTLLGGTDPAPEQLVAVVLLRVVFVSGDGLLALIAGLIRRPDELPWAQVRERLKGETA